MSACAADVAIVKAAAAITNRLICRLLQLPMLMVCREYLRFRVNPDVEQVIRDKAPGKVTVRNCTECDRQPIELAAVRR